MGRDLVSALVLLPDTYRTALRLRLEGASVAEVAGQLGIEHEAVEPLFTVADAKVRQLLAEGERS